MTRLVTGPGYSWLMTDMAPHATNVVDSEAFLARRRQRDTAAAETTGAAPGGLEPGRRVRALSSLDVAHRRRMLRHLGALDQPGAR
jgi:hypothetical protein